MIWQSPSLGDFLLFVLGVSRLFWLIKGDFDSRQQREGTKGTGGRQPWGQQGDASASEPRFGFCLLGSLLSPHRQGQAGPGRQPRCDRQPLPSTAGGPFSLTFNEEISRFLVKLTIFYWSSMEYCVFF